MTIKQTIKELHEKFGSDYKIVDALKEDVGIVVNQSTIYRIRCKNADPKSTLFLALIELNNMYELEEEEK